MSIATKTGDSGTTALLFGKRVPKTHIRVATYGQVDELGSSLGLCRAHTQDTAAKAIIRKVQGELVYLMSEIATDDADQARFHEKYAEQAISAEAVERLTTEIKVKETTAGSFKGWTYAGETVAQAFFDQARTTCRRTERSLIELKESGADVRSELHQYLNRLADLLWLIGREHE
ncbi:MAG: cob(I)alamin adenosyltransferase [Lentimonas sp.]|jgi:cob(I)alamin adenosyltransferase